MAKFVCERCGELVDANDAIIEFKHAYIVGTSIYAFCPKCYVRRKAKSLWRDEGTKFVWCKDCGARYLKVRSQCPQCGSKNREED